MNFKKTILVLIIAGGLYRLSAQTSGQNYTISPYSNFGLGEVLGTNLLQAGSASQTHTGAYSYSFYNPATLGNLKFTTLDFGMHYKTGEVSSGTNKQSYNGGSLNYMALGFPVVKKDIKKYTKDSVTGKVSSSITPVRWNSYLALYPTTSIGYNYAYENANPLPNRTAHSGKGGVNTLAWGNGLRIGNYISFGYTLGYVFGQISENSIFSVNDSLNLALIEDQNKVNVSGLSSQAGLLFNLGDDTIGHQIGISYNWYNAMGASRERLTRTLFYERGQLFYGDTILNINEKKTSFTMPSGFGIGYAFNYKRKLRVALDYRKQYWGNYTAFFQPNTRLSDRTDYGLTLTFNPSDEKAASQKKMKMPVRIGGRYAVTQNVFTIAGNATNIEETNAFIGFGIPFTRRYYDNRVLRSIIHIQFDYIGRGKAVNGLAKEQYLMGTVSVNLGDIWFQRRKFD